MPGRSRCTEGLFGVRITPGLTQLSAFAQLGFGGCRRRGARPGLLAGEFLLAVAGAQLPGDQDSRQQRKRGGDQERELNRPGVSGGSIS
jgi:hypothetical protein